MRKVLKLIPALTLLAALTLLFAPSANAQGGLSGWTSSIQVQNLGSAAATVVLTFYNQDGTVGGTISGVSLNANASISYFPIAAVASGFNGSAVISSDQPVAAITNLVTSDFAYNDSAIGITAGSTSVGLPLIQRGNSGFNTWFNVQNTGSSPASVTITYTPGSAGTATTQTASIPPNASKTFDQTGFTALGTKFIGSARVTSSQPVVVMVNQTGTGSLKSLLSYNGFPSGATEVLMPVIQANNANYFTSINVQNIGTSPATFSIAFGPNTASGGFTPTNLTGQTLAAGAGTNFLQSGGTWTGRYIGSAKLTSNQPVVVVVNQLKSTTPSAGSSYQGLNTAGLTTKVSAPLIQAANSGFFTTLQCQNAGTTATNVTVTYAANTVAPAFTPAADTYSLAPGAAKTLFQVGTENAKWNNRYIGGATITSSSANIACIVNQLRNPQSADQLLSYNAINY